MSFAEYVKGRTVAVVGKAPPVGDQGAQIDGHDIVIRCAPPPFARPGYGRRTDAAFFGRSRGRELARFAQDVRPLKWVLVKDPEHAVYGNARAVFEPDGGHRYLKANQVPNILYDLAHFEPAAAGVYGTDFYLSGPHSDADVALQRRIVYRHDQPYQRGLVRTLMSEHGWITGDGRFLAAVAMSDTDFSSRLAEVWDG